LNPRGIIVANGFTLLFLFLSQKEYMCAYTVVGLNAIVVLENAWFFGALKEKLCITPGSV